MGFLGGGGLVVRQHEAGGGADRGAALRTWADRTRPVRHVLGGRGKVESVGPLRLSTEADEGSRRSSCPRAGTSRAESGKQPDRLIPDGRGGSSTAQGDQPGVSSWLSPGVPRGGGARAPRVGGTKTAGAAPGNKSQGARGAAFCLGAGGVTACCCERGTRRPRAWPWVWCRRPLDPAESGVLRIPGKTASWAACKKQPRV